MVFAFVADDLNSIVEDLDIIRGVNSLIGRERLPVNKVKDRQDHLLEVIQIRNHHLVCLETLVETVDICDKIAFPANQILVLWRLYALLHILDPVLRKVNQPETLAILAQQRVC